MFHSSILIFKKKKKIVGTKEKNFQDEFRITLPVITFMKLSANSVNTPFQANILSCQIIIDLLDQGAHSFVILLYY